MDENEVTFDDGTYGYVVDNEEERYLVLDLVPASPGR